MKPLQLVPRPANAPPWLEHDALVTTTQLPSGKQQRPLGQVLFAPQATLGPAHVPPAPPQLTSVKLPRQKPFERQHAPVGAGHGLSQVVLSPRYVPPCAVQSPVVSTWQEPLGKQQDPIPGVQLMLVHAVRLTQSPVGRQKEKRLANVPHPPLDGQPNAPQFTPKSQLFADCESPEVSVTGNALLAVGGAVVQGF